VLTKRGVRLVGRGNQLDQAAADQRGIRREVRQIRQAAVLTRAKQIERQIDAGPSAGDIVLKVGEEALVTEIGLGREREKQHVQVKTGQVEAASQPMGQTVGVNARRVVVFISIPYERQRVSGKAQHVLMPDDQTAIGIGLGTEALLNLLNRLLYASVQPGQPFLQRAGWGGCLRYLTCESSVVGRHS